jgi:hypothetical protein
MKRGLPVHNYSELDDDVPLPTNCPPVPLDAVEDIHEETLEFYVCVRCGLRYDDEEDLIDHHRLFVFGFGAPFPCELCRRSFRTPVGLRKHRLMHKRVTAQTCKRCQQCYGSTQAMARHCCY